MPFGRGGPATPGIPGSNSRTKRMRTSFKHHQLRTMKSYFAINHNPDAKDLKQLSQKTGLPKRVLQVSSRAAAQSIVFIAFCSVPIESRGIADGFAMFHDSPGPLSRIGRAARFLPRGKLIAQEFVDGLASRGSTVSRSSCTIGFFHHDNLSRLLIDHRTSRSPSDLFVNLASLYIFPVFRSLLNLLATDAFLSRRHSCSCYSFFREIDSTLERL